MVTVFVAGVEIGPRPLQFPPLTVAATVAYSGVHSGVHSGGHSGGLVFARIC